MKKQNKKKGASLIIVLMVLLIAMVLSTVTLTTISRTTKANGEEKRSEDLLYAAESGLQYGIAYFNSKKDNTSSIELDENILPNGFKINSHDTVVKINKISSGYEIISEATSKLSKKRAVSIKIDEKKISTPIGGGIIKLNSPVALIIPSNNKIFYKEGNSTLTSILNPVPPRFNLEKVLNYKNDSKVYKLYKKNNDRGGKIDVTETGKETVMDFEFKTNELTPFSYVPESIAIPSNSIIDDVEIRSDNLSTYFNVNLNTLNCKKTVTINVDWHGDINLNNINIYADKIKIVGHKSLSITNSKLIANSISIEGGDNRIFKNSQIVSNDILINTTANTSFDSININSNKIEIKGNQKEFKNGTKIEAKNLIVNTDNPVYFNSVNIKSENFNILGSKERIFEESDIITNNFNLNVTNGSSFENSTITSGIINLSGSCNKMFGHSTIKANQFNVNSSNEVNFEDTTLFLNKFDMQGNMNRNFNNSIIVSNTINAYTTNNINFTNSLTICENISFNTSNDINFIAIDGNTEEKINAFNNMFKKAQEQLIIKGTSTKDTYEFEFDDGSLDYSSS